MVVAVLVRFREGFFCRHVVAVLPFAARISSAYSAGDFKINFMNGGSSQTRGGEQTVSKESKEAPFACHLNYLALVVESGLVPYGGIFRLFIERGFERI